MRRYTIKLRHNCNKTASASKEKTPIAVDIMKNQKENPAVTANDLNLGEESSILNWINECH